MIGVFAQGAQEPALPLFLEAIAKKDRSRLAPKGSVMWLQRDLATELVHAIHISFDLLAFDCEGSGFLFLAASLQTHVEVVIRQGVIRRSLDRSPKEAFRF